MASKTFFTSDNHFGHKNIIKYESKNRPFDSVEEMNEAMIDNWNRKVPRDAAVYILGDFIMGSHTQNMPIIQLLHGRKFLITGNHDKCWHGHKNHAKHKTAYIKNGITWISGKSLINLAGVPCEISHFPKIESMNKYDEKYRDYHPQTDRVLLHGHVHSAWKIDNEHRQINVGVDVWDLTPICLDEIEDTLKQWT